MYYRGTARDNPWNRNVCMIAISMWDEQDVWIGPPLLYTLSIVFLSKQAFALAAHLYR